MPANTGLSGEVVSVSTNARHEFSKARVDSIELITGIGVRGDAHAGETVKHRSRVRIDPSRPNLRQVHLMQQELITELISRGFAVGPGVMGENITTSGVDLLALPTGSRLYLGGATLEVTGLRNPCSQLDGYQPGLTAAVLEKDGDGNLIRRAGVMSVVKSGGTVRVGDRIRIELPNLPHQKLVPV